MSEWWRGVRSVTYVLRSPEYLDFSACVSTDSLDIGKPVGNFDGEGIAGLAIYSSIDSAELPTSNVDARLPLGLAMESMPDGGQSSAAMPCLVFRVDFGRNMARTDVSLSSQSFLVFPDRQGPYRHRLFLPPYQIEYVVWVRYGKEARLENKRIEH